MFLSHFFCMDFSALGRSTSQQAWEANQVESDGSLWELLPCFKYGT